MISFSAAWAITLRHLRLWRRDANLLLMVFYWPLLDVLIWGFLGMWIQQFHTKDFNVVALLGILLWQFVGRQSNALVMTLAEEFWYCNMLNLFSLPLRIRDWIGGVICFTIIAMFLILSVSMFAIGCLYEVNLLKLMATFIIFLPPTFFSGIWVGFTCLQILMILGKRGHELANVFAWFLLPFSGAYYPIEVLPAWVQKVSWFVPMSHVFTAMRAYVIHNQDPTAGLIKGYALSIGYMIFAILMFVYCFNKSKQKGLAQLMD